MVIASSPLDRHDSLVETTSSKAGNLSEEFLPRPLHLHEGLVEAVGDDHC